MHSSHLLTVAAAAALTVSLAAQYETSFDNLSGAPTGVPLAGQDSFYLPAVAGSVDWNVFTYAGNSLGIPQNLVGGSQFIAGQSLGSTSLARAQRPIAFSANCPWRYSIDFCANFVGTAPASEYLGSFSEQPSTTNANFNLLLSWGTNTANPVAFNIATQVYDAAGTAQAISAVPDLNFQNLNLLQWYRIEASWDFATRQVIELALTDLTTFTRFTYTPSGWYLFGGANGAPLPTDFRFFAGGSVAGNVVACDNFSITALASYMPYGTGCAGSLGVPTLAAQPGSRPALGASFTAVIGNLPLNTAIMVSGFSNTSSPPFTLPLDLVSFGMPGCLLLAEAFDTQFLVGSGNQATWTLNLPNNPRFLNATLFNQGFSLDPTANVRGVTVSNAAKLCAGR